MLTLEDFNQISAQEKMDDFKKRFKDFARSHNNSNMPERLARKLVYFLFGVLNRREDLQATVLALGEIQTYFASRISIRFLITYLLEMSNIELRNRLLYYLEMVVAVPLIYACHRACVNNRSDMRYVPEVLFNMAEGYGILNIGVGQKCIMQCGKSQFLNDILFPNETHKPFNIDDNSAFSSGQVDVFFGKAFANKLNTVFMDGQGELS